MKKYSKKLCLVLLTMILFFQVIDFGFVEAANYDGWSEITSNSNQTLSSGNYKVSSSKTITAGQGANGIIINGIVNLYIEAGVTLTVEGGASSGAAGAGAGIYLPSGSTLRVYGGGQIIANGGNAGSPTQGESPTGDQYVGGGGSGGSGAGAGIGGRGGNGGTGGRRYQAGESGSNGTQGLSAGTLYVYDTIQITATGGEAFSQTLSRATSNTSLGAGGNGGYGGKAANIGAGGSGGGGGGSGGQTTVFSAGNGGSGGGGSRTSLGGQAGKAGGKRGVDGANSSVLYGGAIQGTGDKAGGKGGDSFSGASGGSVYVATTASVSLGSTIPSYGEGRTATQYSMTSITLDHNGGSSSLNSIAGVSGQALPTIDTIPTKTGYEFTGYWQNANGTGNKYINADGSSTWTTWSSGSAIYAGWKGKQYTLSIQKDGISDFTVTGATKVDDTTYTMTYGTSVTLEATPESGKTFIAWYGDDDTYSSPLNPYTFSPPAKNIILTGTAMYGVWVEDTLEFDPSDFYTETFYSTATINVHLDGVGKDMGNVTLENGTDIINVSGTNGVYTYKNILDPSGKEYTVFVGGEDTGQSVKFDSEAGTTTTVDYYSTTIRSTLDGASYNPGRIEFINQSNPNDNIAVFYDDDLGYTYYYRLKDDTKTYRVMLNGIDTGHAIDFANTYDITLDYHTALVQTKVDGNLRDMGTITLRNQNGIAYTLSSNGGVYKIIERDTATYDIFLNDVDTKSDVTFNNTAVDINYFTVSYELVNLDAVGSIPSPQIFKEGEVIKVAGAGNITRPDYHFAGWSDGTAVYPVNSDYTVSATTKFTDTWEANSDSQAKWSFDNGASWNFGTLADAVAVTKQTSTNLKVVIQKSGTLPNNTDMTIRNNQSWEVSTGVDVEILGNSKVTNQGIFTNQGSLSGQGELVNSGHVNNENGVVKVAKINNTDGLLYGGTYGEVNGTNSAKVVITGGQVKAVDANTKVILGDYSTMNGVRAFSDETTISVMGGTIVQGVPSTDQLQYNFGGLATYDQSTNTIKQTCNLFFRDKVIIQDTVWDSDDKTHEGLDTPKVFAKVYEVKGKTAKEYVENDGGTVTINYATSVKGPSTSAEMLVPNGSNVILNATADTSNGYIFVGWYQDIQKDQDGNITGFTTKVSDVPKLTISNIQTESGYYAVFEKKQFNFQVSTDSATKAEIFLDNDSTILASIGNKEKANVAIGFGGNIVVEPKLEPDLNDPLRDSYSFLGFLRNYNDGTTEQVIQYERVPKDPINPDNPPNPDDIEYVDVPAVVPYQTSARDTFDYTLSTLSIIKGYLHYDMNGGRIPDGSAEVITDINLITDQNTDFTLSSVVPIKQGWEFVAWERQDDNSKTRYQPGGTITLTGAEKDAGVLLVAIYKRDTKTQYYVQVNTSPADEMGFKSLDEAVAATKDSASTVYGKKEIFFHAGENTEQVGEIFGLLPNGYTLKSKTSAKLTISNGKSLQIGDETIANTNNGKDETWKTGAYVENITFINNQGNLKFDGQHSWIKNGRFILYPNSKIHLLSDLNTGNVLNVTLWDSADNEADIINSGFWKEDSIVVTSDDDDGDTSTADGNDTNFNLMSGRVRIVNDGYSLYNDFVKSTSTGGFSLKVFASSKVKAMRTPLDDTTLPYADANYIIEYRTIQEAIDDAARSNVGGNGKAADNNIWIVGDSSEDFVITGDHPDKTASHFVDYGAQTYNNEVTFVAGTRQRAGANLSVQANATSRYKLSGEIELADVKTVTYEKETIFNLNNFVLSGTLRVGEGSYINVTNGKTWLQDETITILPTKDANNKIIHKQVIAKDENADSSAHFKLENTAHIAGYGVSFTQADKTIRVEYLGDPIVIIEDLDDVKEFVGIDAVFTTKVQYPTDIDGVELTPDDQEFTYKWYEKKVNAGWSEITDKTNMNVEFNNGEATLTYTIPNVNSVHSGTMYKCEIYNKRGVSVGVKPVTREAILEVENTPSAFISIPRDVELRKTEINTATNVEKNDQDESNMILLQTFKNSTANIDGTIGDVDVPKGIYTIKTDQTFDLALTTNANKKYTVWVFKSDHQTKLPDDRILMELQDGVNEKERFYLRMTLPDRIDLGVYKGQMHFNIDYTQVP